MSFLPLRVRPAVRGIRLVLLGWLLFGLAPFSAQSDCGTNVTVVVSAVHLEGTLMAKLNGVSVTNKLTTPGNTCYGTPTPALGGVSLESNRKYLMEVEWDTYCIAGRSVTVTNSCGCYLVVVDNWIEAKSNTATNGSATAEVYLIATNKVVLSPGNLTPGRGLTATASLPPSVASRFTTNITWSVLEPKLGCEIISVDQATRSCKVLSGDASGSVVIQAKDANGCVAVGTLELGCPSCELSCPIGDVAGSLNSAEFEISLGRADHEQRAGALMLKFSLPSAAMYSPSSLVYSASAALDKSVLILTNANGVIRQARAPEGIADVNVISTNQYTVTFYNLTNITGFSNGVFVIAAGASELTRITVENPDATWATTNRLRITANKDGTDSVYDYEYSAPVWSLATGGGLRNESLSSTISGAIRTDVRTITNGVTTVSVNTRRYETFAWGEALIEEISGSGGSSRTNTYSYYTNGLVRQETRAEGGWKYYTYDESGRPTNVFSGWLNQGPTTNSALCRVTAYSYSSNSVPGSRDNGLFYPTEPRMTVDYIMGVEVSRSYAVFTNGTRRDVRCATAGAAWNAADNLVTITRYFTNGINRDKIRTLIRPDWTVDFYEYTESSNSYTTVVHSGIPDWDFEPDIYEDSEIWFGTITTNIVDGFGRPLLATQLHVSSGAFTVVTQSLETHSDPDGFGRPRRVDYLDGTWTYSDYGCCGQTTVTNREGTVTTTGYDALKRAVSTTVGGIRYTNVLDAAGNVLASLRIGTDTSVITNRTTAFNTAGEIVREADGLGNPTTYTNYFDGSGYWVNETVFPDGGTKVTKYFKDGQVYSISGTAARPATYHYATTNDSPGVLARFEQRGSTSEWETTITDLLGRHYRTVYAAGSSPYPNRRSYYDTFGGQLQKEIDPDGVTSLYWPTGRFWDWLVTFNEIYSDVILDQDQDGVIDRSGADRIRRRVSDVAYDGDLGEYLKRTREYEWYTNGWDSSLLTGTTMTSLDGRRTWRIAYGLTNESRTVYAGGGTRFVTNTTPDGTYTVQTFKDGRPLASQKIHASLGTLEHQAMAYDAHGRLAFTTNLANGTVTAAAYDSADRVVTRTVYASGLANQVTTMVYDSMGRVVRITHPDGASVTNEYFVTGLLQRTAGARTYPVAYGYDSQGRMTNMTTWQNHAAQSGAATTRWKYDGYRGWMTNKAYEGGDGPGYLYTAAGRLSQRTWARGISTSYSYSSLGDLEKVIYSDTGTPSVTNTFDRRGRLITVRQGSETNQISYLDSGLVASESFGSLTVNNVYDDLLRRVTNGIVNSAGTWLTLITNSYDPASRLLTVSDRTNAATYSYLATNRLIQQISHTGSGVERMVTRKQYDSLDRLLGITSSNSVGGVFDATLSAYNEANQRTAVTNADSSRWEYGYDSLGQVTSGRRYWSDGTPVAGQQFVYSFDDIGNRKTAAGGGDSWGANLRYENYTVDALNQYSQRTVPGAVDVMGAARTNATVTVNLQPTTRKGEFYWAQIGADNSGGPVWLGLTNVGALFNTTNDIVTTNTGFALVPKATEAFTYDLDGNLLTDSVWTNAWNAENRLVSLGSAPALTTNAWQRVTWSYYADGRWKERIVSTWNGAAYVPQFTNRFVWDGVVLLAMVNPANALTASLMRGLDLSGSPQGAGGVGGVLAVTIATNGTHFCGYDANGNVISLTSAGDGSTSGRYEYDPFGTTLRANGVVARANPIRFSTQFADEVCGDVKYLYRQLRPSLGRWLSRDPIGERGGINLYGFIGNNAVAAIDFLGLDSVQKPCCDQPCSESEKGVSMLTGDYLSILLPGDQKIGDPNVVDEMEKKVQKALDACKKRGDYVGKVGGQLLEITTKVAKEIEEKQNGISLYTVLAWKICSEAHCGGLSGAIKKARGKCSKYHWSHTKTEPRLCIPKPSEVHPLNASAFLDRTTAQGAVSRCHDEHVDEFEHPEKYINR